MTRMIKRFVDGLFRKVFRLPEPPPVEDAAPVDASISEAGLDMVVDPHRERVRRADEKVLDQHAKTFERLAAKEREELEQRMALSGSWQDRLARARQQNRR